MRANCKKSKKKRRSPFKFLKKHATNMCSCITYWGTGGKFLIGSTKKERSGGEENI